MKTIDKTVTGSTEKLKAVKDGKKASKSPTGGTQRPTFKGSKDPRKSGGVNPNGKAHAGYAAINHKKANHGVGFTSGGVKSGGSTAGAVSPANENIKKGMGGKFKKGTL